MKEIVRFSAVLDRTCVWVNISECISLSCICRLYRLILHTVFSRIHFFCPTTVSETATVGVAC